ncbi:major royal jelly family protein [Saccharopolyspora sp. K220]|uniref:major royal jelly family protein n=1 Tax=Saccharopolyspora soli TaxID=2926618 RepID=UPI001F5901FE|nr:major royal jelly family protein [Saccharopolyspora soli]MCI2423392.1 major royal jelly family protein [Saccharopolyspora soli]
MSRQNASPLGSWVANSYEVVAEFDDLMPTGLTVTGAGRVFVSFPRWGDEVPCTVAEVVDGEAVPYPSSEINTWSTERTPDQLVSVQSVITDPVGHVWLLDTGSLSFEPWLENGPKVVEVDPATDQVVRIIRPDTAAVTPTTYLNDIRFDFSRGSGGYAYLTDSQPEGALIVIDLASGESWSKLRGHESTRAAEGFRAVVQGVVRDNYVVGADGIAVSADGSRLFYCPLSSRRLYSVDTSALVDRSMSDEDVTKSIVDHGDKGASDGLESDTAGNLYATAYEHSAVLKLATDGTWSTVLHGPALLWPDTLAVAADGYLYVSVNQLPRTPLFNGGVDERVPPYQIVRVRVDAQPITLTRTDGNR